jgi:hypothetical protein
MQVDDILVLVLRAAGRGSDDTLVRVCRRWRSKIDMLLKYENAYGMAKVDNAYGVKKCSKRLTQEWKNMLLSEAIKIDDRCAVKLLKNIGTVGLDDGVYLEMLYGKKAFDVAVNYMNKVNIISLTAILHTIKFAKNADEVMDAWGESVLMEALCNNNHIQSQIIYAAKTIYAANPDVTTVLRLILFDDPDEILWSLSEVIKVKHLKMCLEHRRGENINGSTVMQYLLNAGNIEALQYISDTMRGWWYYIYLENLTKKGLYTIMYCCPYLDLHNLRKKAHDTVKTRKKTGRYAKNLLVRISLEDSVVAEMLSNDDYVAIGLLFDMGIVGKELLNSIALSPDMVRFVSLLY